MRIEKSSSGQTIVAYHGSPYSFSAFNPSSTGIHFGSFEQAAHAATLKLGRLPINEFSALQEINGWRGKIYLCEIFIGKSKRIKDPRTPQAWQRQIKKAITEGYTSIVYNNEFEGSKTEDSYCLFKPESVIRIAPA